MKKVFITGSEGFVGQHLVNLLRKDYSLLGLSRNTKLEPQENIDYAMGDILDSNKIYDLLKQHHPDAIIHLAGIAKTWGNDTKEVFNINLFGTLNIYEAIARLKTEDSYDPKIIFISSAEVYGEGGSDQGLKEDTPLRPINTYGTSKLAADRLSFQYSRTNQLRIVILRPFPHAGPGQQKGFFIPDMASQIVQIEKDPDQDEILVGNLQATRDYLDVRDIVQVYKLVLEKDFTSGEVFNVCSGQGITIKSILEKLLALSNKPINIKEDPNRFRPIDLPVFVGNNEKLVKATGWAPTYTIDQTLKDVLDYWRGKS